MTGLSDVYANQLVVAAELPALARATTVLRDVLKLAADPAFDMLPALVRERLQQQLIGPARILVDAAQARTAAVHAALDRGAPVVDHGAKSSLRMTEISPASVPVPDALDRYATGDLVAVPVSGGAVPGVVVEHITADDGTRGLLAEFPDHGGAVCRTNLWEPKFARANPFKLGDRFDVDGMTIEVRGVGPYGSLVATVRTATDSSDLGGWVPPGAPGHDVLHRLRARWGGAAPAIAAPSLQHSAALPTPILLAGGASVSAPVSYAAPGFSAAAYTNCGVGYGDGHNEDAAISGAIQGRTATVPFAGVFDQAGGHGHSGVVGEASALAASGLADATRQIADGAEVDATLRDAIVTLNAAVGALEEEQRTSFAGGVMVTEHGQKTFVALNCGDSMVVHYGADGRVKDFTKPDSMAYDMEIAHNNPNLMIGGVVNSLLGVEPDELLYEIKRFPVADGDFFLCLSDGAIDAFQNEHKRDVKAGLQWTESGRARALRTYGQLVASHGADSAGCAAVAQFALDRMQRVDGFWPAEPATEDARAKPVRAGSPGKPDNVSVVLVRG